MPELPEYNLTGHDFSRREHLSYSGPPIIDVHSHVTMTSPQDADKGPAGGSGQEGTTEQAGQMLDVAGEFHVGTVVTMCPAQDIAPLRERFGSRLLFNAMINKKPEESEDDAFRGLDEYLDAGISVVKLWSAPRGRDRGLTLDAPWRWEGVRRAMKAGIRVGMVHVADPDRWFETAYADSAKFGTKPQQYEPLHRLLAEFPEMTWIAAHMGGDPEHPDHLAELLETLPNLVIDTSATKWAVREVSRHPEKVRDLVCRFPDRFLFGSDLVTRHGLHREHYVSRYWCQRTLWESDWRGPSPIKDPDFLAGDGDGVTPELRGVGLPAEVLDKVYLGNAKRVLSL